MARRRRPPEEWLSLHHHTTFSYLDGYGTPAQHVAAAVDLGMSAMAFTEHGNVTSHVQAEREATKAGIQPIFGCELYTGAVDDETRSRWKWHLTVLAMNQDGYQNLLRLVSRGWSEGFYFEPTVSGEMLAEHSDGLIVLSGCSGSKMACDLLGGKGVEPHAADYRAAKRTALRFQRLFGDRFYLEAQAFPQLERTRGINQAWERLSEDIGAELVITGDVHYPKPEDNEMQLILHAIDRGGKDNTVEKQARGWGYDIQLAPFTARAIYDKAVASGLSPRAAERGIRNTGVIAERCQVTIPKLRQLVYPGKAPSAELFRQWCRKGWDYRGFNVLQGAEKAAYVARVKYELDLIEQKGFVDYFLVISDAVRWAKNNGVPVGPARGSAAGSLVCYLLRITEVNPLLFPGLLFERFIDINRHDLPDIDLDFDDDRRHLVTEYMIRKYGADRVGLIGTFTRYKGRNSLDDVQRVHKNRIPIGAVEKIKELLIVRAAGDLRGNSTIEDSLALFPEISKTFKRYPDLQKALRLEGQLRGFSVHAAGVVVADEPLTNSVAVYTRTDPKTGETRSVTSIDKWDAEHVGALKIDLLGLSTMAIVRLCIELVGMSLEELYAVPLEEAEVYKSFQEDNVTGIFQWDGRAMRRTSFEVQPAKFLELCDIVALARPGPLHSGATGDYIQIKMGKKRVERHHPVFAEITTHTHGQVVYQEQILRVVRELAGFSWEEAASIRKLISKKQGEQAFNRMRDRFMKGAVKAGCKEMAAARIWKQLVTSGAYAFNFAHSVSYAMLAYWCMWLKVNHPREFYTALLQKFDPGMGGGALLNNKRYDKKRKGMQALQEAVHRGVVALPPDPRRSGYTWQPEGRNGIRAGYVQATGLGPSRAAELIRYREAGVKVEAWSDFLEVKGIGVKTIEKIEEACSAEDPFGLGLITDRLDRVRKHLWKNGETLGVPFPRHYCRDVPYEPKPGEYIWAGIVRAVNVKDLYEQHRSRTGEELDPTKVREPQFVNWAVITGEDGTGSVVITVHRFRGQYERYRELIWNIDVKRDVLIVRGHKRRENRQALYAEEVWVIDSETMKVRNR